MVVQGSKLIRKTQVKRLAGHLGGARWTGEFLDDCRRGNLLGRVADCTHPKS
jgi:hypothetical protein